MRFLLRMVATVAANGLALYLAGQYIPNVTISPRWEDIAIAALVLSVINWIVRPFLKLILSPLIILTLGLAVVAINAFTLYAMTQIVPDIVTITGLLALVYATILTSVINIIVKKII